MRVDGFHGVPLSDDRRFEGMGAAARCRLPRGRSLPLSRGGYCSSPHAGYGCAVATAGTRLRALLAVALTLGIVVAAVVPLHTELRADPDVLADDDYLRPACRTPFEVFPEPLCPRVVAGESPATLLLALVVVPVLALRRRHERSWRSPSSARPGRPYSSSGPSSSPFVRRQANAPRRSSRMQDADSSIAAWTTRSSPPVNSKASPWIRAPKPEITRNVVRRRFRGSDQYSDQ